MTPLTKDEVLELVPQQRPFRFIDDILEMDEKSIVGVYTFREDETFYPGHFPGNPITPGVILLETLAQTGVVAHGLFLASLQMPKEDVAKKLTVFTDAQIKFRKMVKPGDRVTIRSTNTRFHRMRIKAEAEMYLDDGSLACKGTLGGFGVDPE